MVLTPEGLLRGKALKKEFLAFTPEVPAFFAGTFFVRI